MYKVLTNKIVEKIQLSEQQGVPFVVYKKPNEATISGFFQQSDEVFFINDYQESGFVFAPFNDNEKAILIPKSNSEFVQQKIDIPNIVSSDDVFCPSDESQKEQHIELVEKGIDAIRQKQFKKVVLSRKEKIEVANFDLVETFQRLLANYPTAFVYVWFHPKVGLWLGATPETLVKFKDNSFETMALAGTQQYNGTLHVEWKQKEIAEQQFVTDYVVENLESVCEKLITSDVKTVKAGNLLHLQTKITGKLKVLNSKLITKLHPTPAVCGLPKQVSKEFILKNENYKREFYTGFMGELNLLTPSLITTNLYVNLRCMQIKSACAYIYIGGGITKNSNAEKEWDETVAKTNTMLQVL